MNQPSTLSPLSLENAEPSSALEQAKTNYLVLSAHDFRSPRKAGMHFIATELAKLGNTRFFSLRYSMLSRYTRDPRLTLDPIANRVGIYQGIECYLWKTLIHPFNTRRRWLRPLEYLLFSWYAQGRNPILRQWIREADVILLESGIAPVFFDLIKQLNPTAKVVYRVSDDLGTIQVAGYISNAFKKAAPRMDTVALLSKAMKDGVPDDCPAVFVPQAIDHSLADQADPSPYGPGIHAVSLGSMLFDPEFFVIASRKFPDIHFHVIGSGHARHPNYGPNVHVYEEMPFLQTLPYIKHANFGIAPYANTKLPVYLRDTSLKLTQYEFFGIPAVCPHLIAGDYKTRFGYTPDDADSIASAITASLEDYRPTADRKTVLNWQQVVARLLNPQAFPDTSMHPEPALGGGGR